MENNQSTIALLLGGAHSGKSQFAENCAAHWRSVAYYATGGQIENSPEWENRILRHKERRPSHWLTIEYPMEIDDVATICKQENPEVLIMDCLTLWMGWKLSKNFQSYSQIQLLKHLETESIHLLKEIQNLNLPVLVVSNEVGEGVVPSSESGRLFREAMGYINQLFAEAAKLISFSIASQNLLLKNSNMKMQNGFSPLGIINAEYIFSELNFK
ncbi:bifunctional adenosylcobinamide kinase/adenosylcobinamide-phosphate guanylyltransferase [Fluviispira vulneris]|uniref:bifunctional adenosylcobinamide kinase/adenosylcobinamide-phosphate guanylyltransferase n=1 Tax=Fluviispira vulneris TaxID=2763012 RepID=UPI0016476C4A|nr:bifunctional adenosylcobinamide kinase/adenosylcobinamide-phosphate guanylyltransferase [Fluviispira vulneris]